MWSYKNPSYGDQIRVNRGLYYHHGIYESDDCVYQFAAEHGKEVSAENAVVCTVTLDEFLKGGLVEVREYTDDEKKKLREKKDIIQYAKDHIGERGYDLISNNCEHFSNRCAFGESTSSQVDTIFETILGMIK